RGERPATLTIDESSRHKAFRCQLVETRPGQSWQLYVDTAPPLEPGTIRSDVVLKTNLPAQPEIRLGVYAVMPERLEVNPRSIAPTATRGRNEHPVRTHVVSLQNNGPSPVQVTNVSVSDPRVKAALH